VVAMVSAAMLSCASLPDYARPQLHISEQDGVATQPGFAYRKLTLADFQAVSLPADLRRYSHNLRARSCIVIRPGSNFKLSINRAFSSGHFFYIGGLLHISFHSSFLPSCSWWNPQVPVKSRAYVLQHEQIHFALVELTSHKVTRRANKELEAFLAFGDTYGEVQNELMSQIKQLAQRIMNTDLKLHTAFDEDTSAFYDPKAQQLWLEKVEKRLAEDAMHP
jgi:hypothetical protein